LKGETTQEQELTMFGILADSFMIATRANTVRMRDARPPAGARAHRRKWYYWRGRRWRPIDPHEF
jgi:hypothetical protein